MAKRTGQPQRRRPSKPTTPFGERLEDVRITYGKATGRPKITMGDFAKILGLEDETYRRYERGETEPNVSTLAKIHEVTGTSLDFLIVGIEPDERSHPFLRIIPSRR